MSSAAKPAHTPGPWVTDGTGMGISTANVGLDFQPMVASTAMADVSLKDARANARLIAAAPELLDALIYLRDCAESGEWPGAGGWLKAQVAIKKAAGEGI